MKLTMQALPWIASACVLAVGCERSPSTTADKTNKPRVEAEVEIQTVPVSGNVYMLIGKGGNIGVSAGDDGVLLIDDQFAPLIPQIKAAYEALPHEGSLRFVLNTHYHGDHVGGNEALSGEATIIAHDNVRVRLAERGKPPGALPVMTFDNTLTVHFNGESIRAVHYPRGHTDSDSVIFFDGANAVHLGDHFFNGRFPFVDLNGGGSPRALRTNIRDILGRLKPDTKIIPGHGPLASVGDLERYLAMIEATIALVEGKIAAGASLEEIKAGGVPAEWKDWGSGFVSTDKWLTTLHTDLTSGK